MSLPRSLSYIHPFMHAVILLGSFTPLYVCHRTHINSSDLFINRLNDDRLAVQFSLEFPLLFEPHHY